MHPWLLYIATVEENSGQLESGNDKSGAVIPLMSTLSSIANATRRSFKHYMGWGDGIPPQNQSSQVNSSFTAHSHVV